MCKPYLVFLLLLAFPLAGFCQSPFLKWVDDMGGPGDSKPTGMITDSQSNIYVSGYFSGTVDFDPSAGVKNLTSVGGYDIYVAKYTAAGALIWAVSMGGNARDQVNNMTIDANGNPTIIGQYASTTLTAGATTLQNKGFEDIFIIHLDTNGNVLWAKTLGGALTDRGEEITADSQGNLIATSIFQSTFNVGGTTVSSTSGIYNGLVIKYDASGNLLWDIDLGGAGDTEVYGVGADSNGNIVVSGSYSGSVDFDPLGVHNTLNNGSNTPFIAQYTQAGKLIWVNVISGNFINNQSVIAIGPNNAIYVTGAFSSAVIFNGSTTLTPLGQDTYIAKYSSTGTFQFAKDMGGSGASSFPYQIRSDAAGNFYVTGYFSGTIDFNPDPAATANVSYHGQTDFFVVKLDQNGNYQWAFGGGSASCNSTLGIEMAVDSNDDVVLGGSFCGTVNFDPSTCTTDNVTAQNSISDTFIATYIQRTNPVVPVPAVPLVAVCAGTSATLSVTSPQVGTSYNWYDSAAATNLLFTGVTYVTAPLNTGTTYYVNASNGSCVSSALASVQVTVNSAPVAPSVVNSQVAVCNGSIATLSILNPQPGFTYNWYTTATSGTAVFTGTDFATPAVAANITYYAEAVNATGCLSVSRTAVNVTISPPPQVTAQGTTICAGASATLTATSDDQNATINWYADATGGNILFTGSSFTTPVLNANTSYYAEAVDKTTSCVSAARGLAQVQLLQPLPAPVVSVDSVTATSLTFQWDAVSGATAYKVSIDNGQTFTSPSSGSNGLTQTFTGLQAEQSITIIVQAIGSSSCQVSSNSMAVTGTTKSSAGDLIFVPNAFTPNADGKNDIVYVHSENIQSLKFYVYDQWGELLYTSLSQQNGWDGTYRGKKEPVGVYVYYLEAIMNDGQRLTKKGTITLIR